MAQSLAKETDQAKRALRAAVEDPRRITDVQFEDILAMPLGAAVFIAERLRIDIPDAGAIEQMAACVVKRPPECLPYMLETTLVR